mmetsp:Transcript_5776/g.12174  ORF Transcript_5776/g.12174 Transcript_5776/m.12174 type:complete len:477 (-) Transcript_5776:963-2393(-)
MTMADENEMRDDVHYRAALLTDLPGLPSDFTPSDDRQGMIHHAESDLRETKFCAPVGRGGLGKELSMRLSHAAVGVAPSLQEPTTTTPPTAARRTPSLAFREGEAETVRKVLDKVDATSSKRMREGFNERNFTAGVLNSFFIFFCLGRFPEHFWILYFVETVIFIPTKFVSMVKAKPLCEALYYLDLCWFLNFAGMLALFAFPFTFLFDIDIPEEWRREVYLAAVGAACGPLLGATLVLPFVAFLFHDSRTMTGLFIHLLPPILTYCFLWHADEIREAWPNVFHLDYLSNIKFFPDSGPFFLPGTGLGTVAGNGMALYFGWFVPYTVWMLAVGLDLPRTTRRSRQRDGTPRPPRYDTVFHSTVRGGLCILIGKACWGRPKSISIQQMENNDFELRDFAVYMMAHATAAVSSIYILAYPCFTSKNAHLCIIAGLIILCVHRGSKRYTYYSTAMYGRLIRTNFEDLIAEDLAEESKTK